VPVTAETIERLPTVSEHELGLVLAEGGQHYAATVFSASWTKLTRRLGLPVRFHDLRHHFATTLLAAGVNPKAVAKAAGMNATTLLETYAHVLPDDDDRIRAALRRAPTVAALRAVD
jgi:integrase